MRPWRVFGFYALPVALLAALLGVFAFLGARLTGGAAPLSLPDTLPAGIMVQPGAILQGQALRIGEAIPNGTTPTFQRPVGSFAYTRDGTTAYLKTGTAATAWSPAGGGGGSGVAGNLTSRAATLTGIPAALLSCFHEDFIQAAASNYSLAFTGSGIQGTNFVTASAGSWQRLSTGATASSRSRETTFGIDWPRVDQSPWYFAIRARLVTVVNANTTVMLGVSDLSTPVKVIGVGVCGAVSTTTYVTNYDSTAGACTGSNTLTGIPTTVNASHLWEIYGNGTSTVNFAVDGTVVSSPTLVSTATGMRLNFDVLNGATAANQEIEIDYFHMCWQES